MANNKQKNYVIKILYNKKKLNLQVNLDIIKL